MDIRNKRCLVTGAGRGLGRQVALDLIGAGAFVHLCDISEDALKGVREECRGLSAALHVCNVADEASVQTLFSDIARMGALDVLVNNAGITRDGLLVKVTGQEVKTMPLESFRVVLDVNLTGVFLCAREAAAAMAQKGGGLIINISSVSRAGNFGQTNYSASKAGVDAMTVTWSKELAKYGIRCAAIAPGYLRTEMVAAIKPEVLEKITAQVPLRRLGEMAEISKTVRFIIENDFVNGKILEIDGGLRL
jgi:3-oxoacyl-[acyl-carrier protein] reductase